MSQITVKDYQQIVEVLNTYVEGNITGKSELMKSIFHENATMYGKMNDGWVEGGIQNLYDIVDQSEPLTGLQSRIDILDITESVASARVLLETVDGVAFTDFHHLIKLEGEWKIISKTFEQQS